jgi:hypothetical protein
VDVVPYLQFRENSVLAYRLPNNPPPPPKRDHTQPTYTGKMTAGSVRRIRTAVEVLLQRSPEQLVFNPITQNYTKFRLTFLTLTLSTQQIIPAPEAYKEGLKPFLRWLRTVGVGDYLWKAELQARGQIHYHITANRFIRYDSIKREWNKIQTRAGWMDDFVQRYGHHHPNSTDIHAVYKVRRLDLYLSKYLAKDGGQIKGKVWGCSESLRGKKLFSIVDAGESAERVHAAIIKSGCRVAQLQRCEVAEFQNAARLLVGSEAVDYANWLL